MDEDFLDPRGRIVSERFLMEIEEGNDGVGVKELQVLESGEGKRKQVINQNKVNQIQYIHDQKWIEEERLDLVRWIRDEQIFQAVERTLCLKLEVKLTKQIVENYRIGFEPNQRVIAKLEMKETEYLKQIRQQVAMAKRLISQLFESARADRAALRGQLQAFAQEVMRDLANEKQDTFKLRQELVEMIAHALQL